MTFMPSSQPVTTIKPELCIDCSKPLDDCTCDFDISLGYDASLCYAAEVAS